MAKDILLRIAKRGKRNSIQIILHTRGGGVRFHAVDSVDERGVTITSPKGVAQRFLVGPKGYKVARLPGGRPHLTLYEWLQAPPAGFYDKSEWVEDPMVTPEWAKVSEDASSMKDLISHDEVDWKDRFIWLIMGGLGGYVIATIAVPIISATVGG